MLVENIPPIIPINGIISSRKDLYFDSTFTLIGDMSYLKNIPGVPWLSFS